jgi:hypothetical protein
LKEVWNHNHWLSDEEAEVFSAFGYYSKPLSGTNGKIIALNSQACDDMNWWLLDQENRQDPGSQIHWLEN